MLLRHLAVGLALLFAFPLAAQNTDPFGANPFGADPFGGGPQKARRAPAANQKPQQPKSAPAKAEPKKTKQPRDVEAHIREQLGKTASINAVDVPLQDVLMQLSQSQDIPIVVDRRALEEIGLTPDTPIKLSLHNVTLRSLLRLMLRDVDLTYMIKDEVMQITTIEAAEQNLTVRTYTIADVLVTNADQLVKAMQATVVSGAWDVKGGPCTASIVGNVLAIAATDDIHDQVSDFMEKVEQAATKREKAAK